MFKVDGYKINFWRFTGNIPIPSQGMVLRDITSCSIRKEGQKEEEEDIYSGLTVLNPIDEYDKVVGKKIALTHALTQETIYIKDETGTKVKRIIWHVCKEIRVEIWKAFWEWVDSWDSVSAVSLKEQNRELRQRIEEYEKETQR